MAHIPAGPGQSFSLPLVLSTNSTLSSPSSTSSTVLDSPQPPYGQPRHHRASLGPSAYGTPLLPAWDIERDEKRCALVESLNRSVTIVFWYQANTQPLRLHQEIPTFPLFSFNDLTELVEQLRISPKSYVDTFDPRACGWEQQQVSSVRRIESEQRLLYRMRRSLFDGLRDEECPGLEAELRLQEEMRSSRANALQINSVRKRSGDSSLSPPVSKHHRSFSAHSFASSSTNVESPSSNGGSGSLFATPLPPVATSTFPNNAYSSSPPSRQSQSLANALSSPQQAVAVIDTTPPERTNIELYESTLSDHGPFQLFAPPASRGGAGPSGAPPDPSPSEAAAPTDSHSTAPHPQSSSTCSLPLAVAALAPPQAHGSPVPRKWPNDFFVYEIAAGLRAMEAFAAAEPALKQDEVFRRAFALPYVKSTFCRHRALWRGAGEAVRREYEQLGRDPRACWGEFARRVEGREELAPAGAGAAASMQDAGRRQAKRMRGRTGG
ncbi:hypothetical protein BC628DRAFT_1359629, partial [Trametes gibbosa]